jgi:putative phosphoesterase
MPVLPLTSGGTVTLIGVISDTHGYLPDGVAGAFAGVSRILHAGDIDNAAVLEVLGRMAPVTAVRGNMDNRGEVRALNRTDMEHIAGRLIYMKHSIDYLDIDPVKAGVACVVSGHTHRPRIETAAGVLYLNPGSASRPRGGFAPSVALLRIDEAKIDAEIIDLDR